MPWSTPNSITPATKIADTDDKIEANAVDLEAYVNGTAPYNSSTGMTANMVDKTTVQTITAAKTFSTNIAATGGVTGALTGTASNASALGNEVVTDSVVSTSLTIPAALNSVKTAYDKGVSAETDAATAQATADTKIGAADYATFNVGGTVKARISGTDLYLTINGVDA